MTPVTVMRSLLFLSLETQTELFAAVPDIAETASTFLALAFIKNCREHRSKEPTFAVPDDEAGCTPLIPITAMDEELFPVADSLLAKKTLSRQLCANDKGLTMARLLADALGGVSSVGIALCPLSRFALLQLGGNGKLYDCCRTVRVHLDGEASIRVHLLNKDMSSDVLTNAASRAHDECVRWRLLHGVTDLDGAVTAAATNGHLALLNVLQNKGAKMTSSAAVEGAAFAGQLECLRFLEEHGARLKPHTKALYCAARNGHAAVVRHMALAGVDVNHAERGGFRPIHEAARNGHAACVEALLAAKAYANVNLDREQNLRSPLIDAAAHGHTECVALLLGHLSVQDANWADADGFTALIAAADNGHTSCVQLLVRAGVDLARTRVRRGFSALHSAAIRGHLECVKALVEAGAPIDQVCTYGGSALYWCRNECRDYLVSVGASTNLVARGEWWRW